MKQRQKYCETATRNTMKQGRKCCETAMKRYYETAPIINNNNTVKVDFIPLSGTMNQASVCCLLGGGRGRGASVNKSAITEVLCCTYFLRSCFKLIKNIVKNKNALISIPISLLDSSVHGASFELTYLYHLFCLGPGNYITMSRTPKILCKFSKQYG